MSGSVAFSTLDQKRSFLMSSLQKAAPLLVAYSGGVDSAYLLHAAHESLSGRYLGIIADSPSLPRSELAEALALAKNQGWQVEIMQTQELEDPRYAANPLNRCYYCKHELFHKLEAYAEAHSYQSLAYGENLDDTGDFRPGQEAAKKFRVLAPLRDAGLTKAEIRQLSAEAGLPTHSKPAQPCLSSRLVTGLPVTTTALSQVERGEAILRGHGFRIVRLRHHGSWARLQAAPEEHSRLQSAELQAQVRPKILALGFDRVEFDAQPYVGPSLK